VPAQIDRSVPGRTQRPRENVVGFAELCAVFQCREYHLLKDVVGGMDVPHHGCCQSSEAQSFAEEYLNNRIGFESHASLSNPTHE
jgi:hypothetical protein